MTFFAWLCTKSEVLRGSLLCESRRSLRLTAIFNAEIAKLRRGSLRKRRKIRLFVQSHFAPVRGKLCQETSKCLAHPNCQYVAGAANGPVDPIIDMVLLIELEA